jgi:hypothetical protein
MVEQEVRHDPLDLDPMLDVRTEPALVTLIRGRRYSSHRSGLLFYGAGLLPEPWRVQPSRLLSFSSLRLVGDHLPVLSLTVLPGHPDRMTVRRKVLTLFLLSRALTRSVAASRIMPAQADMWESVWGKRQVTLALEKLLDLEAP